MSTKTGPNVEPCYRDYVIAKGQFIGRFEDMYRDVEDPWGCVRCADAFANRVLLELLQEITPPRTVMDVGCGLGALTARIFDACKPLQMHACDISTTAVAKAKLRAPAVNFFVHDLVAKPILPFPADSVDLIIVAELVWYILPVLADVFREFIRLLAPGGAVILKQAFYPLGVQEYGREFVSCPEDVLKYMVAAGLSVDWRISIMKEDGSQSWICRGLKS